MADFITTETIRDNLVGKWFCSDINNPLANVKVVSVRRKGSGFQVIINRGNSYNLICGYKKFLKTYPYKLKGEQRD